MLRFGRRELARPPRCGGGELAREGTLPFFEVGCQLVEFGVIGVGAGPDDDIHRSATRKETAPCDFAESPSQTVALNHGGTESGDHESEPGMPPIIGAPIELETRAAPASTCPPHGSEIHHPIESPAAGEPFPPQPPPCFEGSRTVRCLRPFFRRRLRIARPHRVRIRARNPCLLVRRLLRGRYVGFMLLA